MFDHLLQVFAIGYGGGVAFVVIAAFLRFSERG
jgi:hypothetical protein